MGKKGSSKFKYSAASTTQDRLRRFKLYIPDIPVQLYTISASPGSINAHYNLCAKSIRT